MPDKAQDDDLIMGLVELSLERPVHERESYLRSACAGDSKLFDVVWRYVQSDQRMNGFLLDAVCSPLPEQHFDPESVLDGRFRIIREVAQGGMGIVYEAFDEKLDRRIAIKCAKAGFHKRLPPEVRNAREISHTNVCKIFEIHTASTEQGEIDFLAMEFLDGETLAERLRRGPFPEKEARTIARQLCAGLAEAHRNDVIHGDLKSSNIILTAGADGAVRAVITDFGLARQPGAAQGSGQSGEPGGTPDYMAPELWRGEKASFASDIYALGVILYELTSGRRPAARELPRSAESWPHPLSSKPAAVHSKWDRILARCLDPDPAGRFHDGHELALALAPPRSRKWLLGAAAAVVLVIASVVATYERATAPQDTVRLVALPFSDAPLTRELSDQLAHIKSSNRTKLTFLPLPDKVDTLEKARAALGATHVLHGTLTREKDQVILHAYLADARTHANAKEWKVEYAPEELRYVPVALAGMVTGTLHLPPLAITPMNAAARQDYSIALSCLRTNSRVDEAIARLERSVAADPDSPLTHAALAEAEWLKYFITGAAVWRERVTESVRRAENRDPDVAEVRRISGLVKASSGWYEQAELDYLRAIELQPDNSDGYRRLGNVYELNSQLNQALAAFQKALALDPNYFRLQQDVGAFYFNQARFSDALPYLARGVELAPNEPNPRFALASAYKNLGRFAEAENQLHAALAIAETPNALHALGLVLMNEQREVEAVPAFLRTLKLKPDWYLAWLNLGICYRRTNRMAESADANRRGLEAAQAEIVKDPRSGDARAFLAYLCAATGDYRRAESEIAQALQLTPASATARNTAALTYELMGRREATLGVLSASSPGTLAYLSRWPDAAALQKDPRFKQMLANSQTETRR